MRKDIKRSFTIKREKENKEEVLECKGTKIEKV